MTIYLTSHTLDGTNGKHATDIPVRLEHVKSNSVIIKGTMDEGGRFSVEIPSEKLIKDDFYDIIFSVTEYWEKSLKNSESENIIDEIVIRFRISSASTKYHIPVIMSPNSYSIWKSN